MDAEGIPTVHTIRTAMRMSRHTVKAKKSLDAQSPFSLLTFHPPETGVEREAVRLPGRKKTVRPSHDHHSALLDGLANSPYLASDAKPEWDTVRDKHKEKPYKNWEIDECPLEEANVASPLPHVHFHESDVVASNPVDLKIDRKRPLLFRPHPIKASKSTLLSPIRPTLDVHTRARHRTIHHSALKQSQTLLSPHSEAAVQSSVLPKAPVLQLVLRITAIESADLDESGEGLEGVFKEPRAKRARVQKPIQTHFHRLSAEYNPMTSYNEETALVLGDTKSIARRRSGQMIIPERLFRYMNLHT